ncbi:MAG TPA: hypothetical protein DEB39_11620 [Planctomycetaceae bacterium]|nr:hypothetical protein [Planctomycetaceae bacterium]
MASENIGYTFTVIQPLFVIKAFFKKFWRETDPVNKPADGPVFRLNRLFTLRAVLFFEGGLLERRLREISTALRIPPCSGGAGGRGLYFAPIDNTMHFKCKHVSCGNSRRCVDTAALMFDSRPGDQ